MESLRAKNYECERVLIGAQANGISDHPLTLSEVINIALSQNLDILVKEQERLIQNEAAVAAKLKMLPSLTADGLISRRSNSPNFTDSPPQAEKKVRTWNVTAAWNLLDFGLSYFRARQEANRQIVADQQYVRIRQNLILDVTDAYWKVVTLQEILDEFYEITALANEMKITLDRHVENRNLSRIQSLRVQDQILEAQFKTVSLEEELHAAQMKLVALMGLPSYAPFKLARPHLCRDEVQLACIEDLEQEALLSRPELVIKDIDEKIMADEVRANIIQMFPGLTLFKSYNYDANRFLENHHWMVVGARATWNLLSIPNLAYTANVARGQKHLARFNRLSLSVGILAQVRLAYLNYLDKLSQYKLAREWSDIRTQLVDVAERERELGEFNDIDVLNFKLVAVFSKYVALKAYAALKISIEQINNSIGRPLLFGGMTWSCQDPNWVCEDEAVSNCEEI